MQMSLQIHSAASISMHMKSLFNHAVRKNKIIVSYIQILMNSNNKQQQAVLRSADMEELTYERAIKKAQLVERNPQPNGVALLDPLRVSKHDAADIITLAEQIQNADKQIQSSTCQKLCIILDQIKMLQAQAMEILKESDESRLLHNAACNFSKKPGHVYHLYQRSSGQTYFSMLSPEEWNGSVDQVFMGSYRLEFDLSWTPIAKVKERDDKMRWAEKCIQNARLETNTNAIAIEFPATEQMD